MTDLARVKNVIFIILVSCASVFFTPRSCFAQDQTLAISNVPLKIGMPQSVVLENLMENLKVEKVQGNSSSYMVLDRKSGPVGAVKFDDGRLTLVEKFWQAGEDVKAYEAAESLAAIFAQLEERGLTLASISTRVRREPNFTGSTSELRFAGNRKITISVWQFAGKAKSFQIYL